MPAWQPGLRTGTILLLGLILLLVLTTWNAVDRDAREAPPVPVPDQVRQSGPPPAPKQEPVARKPDLPPLDTSLDSILTFDEPPLLAPTDTEPDSELARKLATRRERRVSVGGEVYFTEEAGFDNPDVEGGLIEVEITTR